MEWFGPIRLLLLSTSDSLVWLVPVATTAAALAVAARKRRTGTEAAFLVLIFGLAIWAQVFVGRQDWLVGGSLYGAAALSLVLWLLLLRAESPSVDAATGGGASARSEPAAFLLPQRARLAWQVELLLVVLVIVVAAFARFHRFDSVPYGIEGDESRWSTKVATEMLADRSCFDSRFTRDYLPYSYWTQTATFSLMGVGTQTARWQVAFASLIATGLFYLVARKLLGQPGALIATLLMAVSLIDVSASRFSHVECHIKLPVILSFLFLIYAVDSQRWFWYPLTGMALTLGLLSYDTFFVVPAVVGIWLGTRLLLDRRVGWLPSRGDLLGKVGRGLLFLAPIALVAKNSLEYISVRSGYHRAIGTSLQPSDARSWDRLGSSLAENLGQTLANFSSQRWGDFFFNREGPIFNGALIPFAVLGLVYVLVRWRRGQNALIALWFILTFFPVPLVLGTPYVRIFYPAVPAFYLLTAVAAVLLGHELFRAVGRTARAALAVGAGTALALVGATNLHIYFHEMLEFPERIARRQLVDAFSAHLRPGAMLFVPYMPLYADLADVEREYLQFISWGVAPVDEEDSYYRLLTYEELLPALSRLDPAVDGATVLLDRASSGLVEERRAVIDAVLRCFPGARVERGERLDAVVIPGSGLRSPRCTTEVSVTPLGPSGAEANQPLTLAWRIDPPDAAATVRVELARHLTDTHWFEAEELIRGPGWHEEDRFAPGFSARGYLADHFDAPDISARVELPSPGRYTVWVRTHRRITAEMPLTITIGDRSFPAALHPAEEFNTWRWERLGEVDVSELSVPVTLHREFSPEAWFMSVFIDALVFTQEPGFRGGQDRWPLVMQSPELPAKGGRVTLVSATNPQAELDASGGSSLFPVQLRLEEQPVEVLLEVDDPDSPAGGREGDAEPSRATRTGTVAGPLPPGSYRWRVQAIDGDRIVAPTGEVGRWSEWARFTVGAGP